MKMILALAPAHLYIANVLQLKSVPMLARLLLICVF